MEPETTPKIGITVDTEIQSASFYYKPYNRVPALLELCYDWLEFNFDSLPSLDNMCDDVVRLVLPELLARKKRGSSTLNEMNISQFFSDLVSLDLQSFWYFILNVYYSILIC
jgi:hypothetical protein